MGNGGTHAAGFAFAVVTALGCTNGFPFEVEAMPVRKDIALGETAEIRCLLTSEGDFSDTRYSIRYQPEGEGEPDLTVSSLSQMTAIR